MAKILLQYSFFHIIQYRNIHFISLMWKEKDFACLLYLENECKQKFCFPFYFFVLAF